MPRGPGRKRTQRREAIQRMMQNREIRTIEELMSEHKVGHSQIRNDLKVVEGKLGLGARRNKRDFLTDFSLQRAHFRQLLPVRLQRG